MISKHAQPNFFINITNKSKTWFLEFISILIENIFKSYDLPLFFLNENYLFYCKFIAEKIIFQKMVDIDASIWIFEEVVPKS